VKKEGAAMTAKEAVAESQEARKRAPRKSEAKGKKAEEEGDGSSVGSSILLLSPLSLL